MESERNHASVAQATAEPQNVPRPSRPSREQDERGPEPATFAGEEPTSDLKPVAV
jgi:hypothetical protein